METVVEAAPACRLCQRAPAIKKSHVVPEWGYAPFYDDRHRFLHISMDGSRAAYLQKGIREPLLCPDCETRFSRFENYARNVLTVPGRLRLPLPRQQARQHVEYRPFKLFQLSLLWRAHLSTHPMFRDVDVGPRHAERLRLLLDHETPGAPHEYPCLMAVSYLDGRPRPDFGSQAQRFRSEAHHVHDLDFAGFRWRFIVSSHAERHRCTANALQADGRFDVVGIELLESEEWRGAVAKLVASNQENVARLKARDSRQTRREGAVDS